MASGRVGAHRGRPAGPGGAPRRAGFQAGRVQPGHGGALAGPAGPELAELLEGDHDTEHETLVLLLARAADAGQVDLPLPAQDTAAWIQSLIGSLFLRAATESGFDAATQLRGLRRLLTHLLRGEERLG
ncbi:hypothetical protein RIF23_07450 [Lipingzhangella sp. LS1_29]|uniref:Tetracyclin repressor-like C-terminal domain-containing protein n=1 Tax=Lipingzhangella rawalii TaxID=2055835 RepID=A0ABU2H4A6_9ACTN|nr:hypothetical protein [Lipingzhangella rawalii]MDS1270126.1 hypothetical protein [Lipingzhangella rawalii]